MLLFVRVSPSVCVMGETVAALSVSREGPYWMRPGVVCWDAEHDARKREASATPEAFAETLIKLARHSKWKPAA